MDMERRSDMVTEAFQLVSLHLFCSHLEKVKAVREGLASAGYTQEEIAWFEKMLAEREVGRWR